MDRRDWRRWAHIFLFCQLMFCLAVALASKAAIWPPVEKYAMTALSFVIIVVAVRAAWEIRRPMASPIRHLTALDWQREAGFAHAMLLVWLQFVFLTWGKAMLPMATTMWADPFLARLEASLIGADAWTLLPAPGRWVDAIYLAWLPTIGLMFAILYFSRRPKREESLLAFFLTIGLLGTIGQYLLPSGGPIFFERLGLGTRFAAMEFGAGSARVATTLWNAFEGRYAEFATGISAFPSIHVATSAWAAIALRHYLASAYLAFIFAGSIMLGWHYALDGVAGAAGALACHLLARRLLASQRLTVDAASERPALSH